MNSRGENGSSVENLRGRGVTSTVTPGLARLMVREVRKNLRITTNAVLKNPCRAGANIARQTVQNEYCWIPSTISSKAKKKKACSSGQSRRAPDFYFVVRIFDF